MQTRQELTGKYVNGSSTTHASGSICSAVQAAAMPYTLRVSHRSTCSSQGEKLPGGGH